ncbi:hypothetical protein JCM8547_008769 [Rhodosporidiobolus lusitaniae]
MGFSDLFSSSSGAPQGPSRDALHVLALRSIQDRDVVIQKLTVELMQFKERNRRLEEESRAAVGARKGAVERVRELEDVLRLKEGIFESLERRISNLESQNAALLLKEQELFALRLEQAEQPLSNRDLEYRFEQLGEVFSDLKDHISCPVCYEPLEKNQLVSMSCGHTFCKSCHTSWEQRHMESFRLSPEQGQYQGAECPECRTPDPRRGKIRIWALEEIVRLVDRATREIANKPYTPNSSSNSPAKADTAGRARWEAGLTDVQDGEEETIVYGDVEEAGVPQAQAEEAEPALVEEAVEERDEPMEVELAPAAPAEANVLAVPDDASPSDDAAAAPPPVVDPSPPSFSPSTPPPPPAAPTSDPYSTLSTFLGTLNAPATSSLAPVAFGDRLVDVEGEEDRLRREREEARERQEEEEARGLLLERPRRAY